MRFSQGNQGIGQEEVRLSRELSRLSGPCGSLRLCAGVGGSGILSAQGKATANPAAALTLPS